MAQSISNWEPLDFARSSNPYEQQLRRLIDENRFLKDEIEYLRQKLHRDYYINREIPRKAKTMNSLSLLAKRILDPQTRALIKAGVLADDLTITEEGTEFLLGQYLADNKEKLSKEAKKLTKERKDECEE